MRTSVSNFLVDGVWVGLEARLLALLLIPPHTQAWFTVTANRHGLVISQPYPKLYVNHMLNCTNGVVKIEPKCPSRVLVGHFSNVLTRVVRNQTIATV